MVDQGDFKPYDQAAEETVAGLSLVNQAVWEQARGQITARDFFTERCGIVWQALIINGWGENAVKDAAQLLHNAFSILDDKRLRYYAVKWLPELIARSYEVVDMGEPMLSQVIVSNIATVKHLARIRELMYQADRMRRMAEKPEVNLDAVIRDAVEKLQRFVQEGGGISAMSQYHDER